MSLPLYVYFGNETFKIIPIDLVDADKTIMYEPSKCIVFKSEHFLQDFEFQNIYLGWSFAILKFANKFYHTGYPNSEDKATEIFQGIGENVLIISCAENKVFACTKSGKFYFYSTSNLKLRSCDLSCEHKSIKNLVHGEIQIIALMEDGSVYKVDLSDEMNLRLDLFQLCSVKQVSCGKEHTIFLSEQGQVYTLGSGSHGQLGHGTIEAVSKPTLVDALDGVRIKTVACGGWHSTAVSCVGDLYTWGWNENGQLGFPCAKLCTMHCLPKEVETVCCLPKIVEFGEEKEIVMVSCGTRHTAVLTENNEVWTWGWNAYNQLGYNTQPNLSSDKPHKLKFCESFVPKYIKCAFWSTLICGDFKM